MLVFTVKFQVCICRDLSATSPTCLLRRLPKHTSAGVKTSELRTGDKLFEAHKNSHPNIKEKQSHYRPGQAPKVPEC